MSAPGDNPPIQLLTRPATVYVASDRCTPCWGFLLIGVNRSSRKWTLASVAVSLSGAGDEEVSKWEIDLAQEGVVVQGDRVLEPGGVVVVCVRDQADSCLEARKVLAEARFRDEDGGEFAQSVVFPLVPCDTLALEFPLVGRWTAANARRDFHSGDSVVFAFDFVAEEDMPLHTSPSGKLLQPEDFASFGRPLYSPTEGTVVAFVDDRPDLPCTPPRSTFHDGPPKGQPLAVYLGNYILIQRDDGACVVLVHLRQGSARVRVGERVAAGTLLGEIGNSGNTSGAHLHVEVLDGVPDYSLFGTMEFARSGVPFGFATPSPPDSPETLLCVPQTDGVVEGPRRPDND